VVNFKSEGKSRGESRKTILVVDDIPENIDVLKGILSKQYTVLAATSGAKALEIPAYLHISNCWILWCPQWTVMRCVED